MTGADAERFRLIIAPAIPVRGELRRNRGIECFVDARRGQHCEIVDQDQFAGERAILATGCRHLILRTSWVFGPRGSNFLLTILRAARERPELRVVSDQIGAPTSARSIAAATARAIGLAGSGLYHLTAAGETSWHGFAEAAIAAAGLRTPVVAIPSAEYPAAARRLKNSRLDCSRLRKDLGIELPHWRGEMAAVMAQVSRYPVDTGRGNR